MRYLALLILPVILFTACRKKTFPVGHTERYYYKYCEYQKHMRIDTFLNTSTNDIYYTMKPDSNSTVFQYINGSDIRNANDAGFSYTVTFQVDSGVTSFSYSGNQLKDHMTYYHSGGAWSYSGQMLIDAGTIAGQKQSDGTWKINILVDLPRYDELAQVKMITDDVIAKEFVRQ